SLVAGGEAPAPAGDKASNGNERAPTAEPPPPLRAVAPADVVPIALPPAPTPPAAQARFGAGAFAEALFGPSPGFLLGLGIEVSVALDRASVWSPLLGLRVTHGARNGLVEPGGTAGFTLDAISLDACPIRVRFAPL